MRCHRLLPAIASAILLLCTGPSAIAEGSPDLVIEVIVEGLQGEDTAELQLLPDTPETADRLLACGLTLPRQSVRQGIHRIDIPSIPDGSYRLAMTAPPEYFREPQGYLFQVLEARIVRRSDLSFRFRLVPPAAQVLPPCRNLTAQQEPSSSEPASRYSASGSHPACMAEYTLDLSGPSLQPEPPEGDAGASIAPYYYAGPTTAQDNQGVWGRSYVVNPSVTHGGATEFVTERVYADSGASWMEAGWAEVSWRGGEISQYVYVYESVNHAWRWYDEYPLSVGTPVEVEVRYVSSSDQWRAQIRWGGSWHVLAQESLGFTTADRGHNRGEVYTDDGTCPILPISRFDRGYLYINDVWMIWDTRYPTSFEGDVPYQCDMIEEYHSFLIHSPLVFLPVLLSVWQLRR